MDYKGAIDDKRKANHIRSIEKTKSLVPIKYFTGKVIAQFLTMKKRVPMIWIRLRKNCLS